MLSNERIDETVMDEFYSDVQSLSRFQVLHVRGRESEDED